MHTKEQKREFLFKDMNDPEFLECNGDLGSVKDKYNNDIKLGRYDEDGSFTSGYHFDGYWIALNDEKVLTVYFNRPYIGYEDNESASSW